MKQKKIDIGMPLDQEKKALPKLSQEEFQDKILGAIVGSAIGDAMGASTEMWNRNDIQQKYGYITGLTPAIRNKSPEGTWKHNMVAGSTTDDTRWKVLVAEYLVDSDQSQSAKGFAAFISKYYQDLVEGLSSSQASTSTDILDEEMERINWIKEWARVAMAYSSDNVEFEAIKNRFYGGEMSCAGMLYTPMFGLIAKSSEEAYLLGFEHAIFDIGYARDISALVSTMTFNAMHFHDVDSMMEQSMLIDPYKYTDSRLIGRLSMSMLQEAKSMVNSEILIPSGEELEEVPPGFPGKREEWFVQSAIYDKLTEKQMAIAFHAGEIWQILIAGLEFGKGDFLKTMQFIVNYGRDNDTVAAVAGMILGAHVGYSELPVSIKDEVLRVSREVMGLDLEEVAGSITRLGM